MATIAAILPLCLFVSYEVLSEGGSMHLQPVADGL
jgi:hypothetical protein